MIKKIISVLLLLIFLGCVGGGVYSSVKAAEQDKLYKQEMATYNLRKKNISDNEIGNILTKSKERAEDAKKQADIYKLTKKSYQKYAALLFAAAAVFLAGFIVMLVLIKKGKKPKKSE